MPGSSDAARAAYMVGQGLEPKMTIMRETKIRRKIPVRLITCAPPFLPKEVEREVWRQS